MCVCVCLKGRRACYKGCHWVHLQDCDVYSEKVLTHTHPNMHHLSPPLPQLQQCACTVKHAPINTPLCQLGHTHSCPSQQQKGPLTHTPTYKWTHFATHTNINTSCSTVFCLYLENVLRQCEIVKLSMRFVPDRSLNRAVRVNMTFPVIIIS